MPYTYLLKVIVCSAIFLGYYYIALRNKIYHQYNRFYLLFVSIASWFIPLLSFNIFIQKKEVALQPVYQVISYISQSNETIENTAFEPVKSSFNIEQTIPILYFFISIIMVAFTVVTIIKIKNIATKYNSQKINGIKLVLTQEKNTPFSFFKTIFWNTNIDLHSTIGNQILQHELVHIQQKHSWDKLLIQLNLIVGWFNPFFWVIKNELEMIHEFIADKKSIPNSSTADLAAMLLSATFSTNNFALTNPFFFSPIKRRIMMLTKKTHPKFSYLQRIVALPLLALAIVLFSFKVKEKIETITKSKANNTVNNVTAATNLSIKNGDNNNEIKAERYTAILTKKYKVVIDAGHGGKDFGGSAQDGKTHEKDIALAIAKLIKEENTNDNIEIILSREEDRFDDPKAKANFCNNQNADLFVSVHCNYYNKNENNTEERGTKIYVVNPQKNNGFLNESQIVASSVSSFLGTNFRNNGVRQRQTGIWVLQGTKCPGMLIETGLLSNKDDLKILKNKEKQTIMATDILQGIEHYFAIKESKVALQIAQQNTTINNENIAAIKDAATDEEIKEYNTILAKYKKNYSNPHPSELYEISSIPQTENDRLLSIFFKMSKVQKENQQVTFSIPKVDTATKYPTNSMLQEWANDNNYSIWIDAKLVDNVALKKYVAADFPDYNVGKYLYTVNTSNYKIDESKIQVALMTKNIWQKFVDKQLTKKDSYRLIWKQ